MNTKCQHEHSAPIETIKCLPVTQAGIARHRCAICAYEKGLLDGFRLAKESLDISDESILEKNRRQLLKITFKEKLNIIKERLNNK